MLINPLNFYESSWYKSWNSIHQEDLYLQLTPTTFIQIYEEQWHHGREQLPPLIFRLSENFFLSKNYIRNISGKGIFTVSFRKPGWTEQSNVISECIFEVQFLYADRSLHEQIPDYFLLHMQHENSVWKFLILFSTNFAVGNLQLSVRKLQLPDSPNFFSPRSRWWRKCRCNDSNRVWYEMTIIIFEFCVRWHSHYKTLTSQWLLQCHLSCRSSSSSWKIAVLNWKWKTTH